MIVIRGLKNQSKRLKVFNSIRNIFQETRSLVETEKEKTTDWEGGQVFSSRRTKHLRGCSVTVNNNNNNNKTLMDKTKNIADTSLNKLRHNLAHVIYGEIEIPHLRVLLTKRSGIHIELD